MQKNLPYFLVIAALIFLIIAVLSSGKEEDRADMTAQCPEEMEIMQEGLTTAEIQPVPVIEEEKKVEIAAELGGEEEFIDEFAATEDAAEDFAIEKTFEQFEQVEEQLPVFEEPETITADSPGKVLFGFEKNPLTWEIPDWCFEKNDYVAQYLGLSGDVAREADASLKLMADFPGARWTAAYVEVQEYFDWTPYKTISADVYLPEDAPWGLNGKFIFTVGEGWKWTEMSRSSKLTPGKWTTISASIVPGSTDWRRTQVTDAFRADIRKLGIRFESNMRPVYSGPIYVDNIKLE